MGDALLDRRAVIKAIYATLLSEIGSGAPTPRAIVRVLRQPEPTESQLAAAELPYVKVVAIDITKQQTTLCALAGVTLTLNLGATDAMARDDTGALATLTSRLDAAISGVVMSHAGHAVQLQLADAAEDEGGGGAGGAERIATAFAIFQGFAQRSFGETLDTE